MNQPPFLGKTVWALLSWGYFTRECLKYNWQNQWNVYQSRVILRVTIMLFFIASNFITIQHQSPDWTSSIWLVKTEFRLGKKNCYKSARSFPKKGGWFMRLGVCTPISQWSGSLHCSADSSPCVDDYVLSSHHHLMQEQNLFFNFSTVSNVCNYFRCASMQRVNDRTYLRFPLFSYSESLDASSADILCLCLRFVRVIKNDKEHEDHIHIKLEESKKVWSSRSVASISCRCFESIWIEANT